MGEVVHGREGAMDPGGGRRDAEDLREILWSELRAEADLPEADDGDHVVERGEVVEIVCWFGREVLPPAFEGHDPRGIRLFLDGDLTFFLFELFAGNVLGEVSLVTQIDVEVVIVDADRIAGVAHYTAREAVLEGHELVAHQQVPNVVAGGVLGVLLPGDFNHVVGA